MNFNITMMFSLKILIKLNHRRNVFNKGIINKDKMKQILMSKLLSALMQNKRISRIYLYKRNILKILIGYLKKISERKESNLTLPNLSRINSVKSKKITLIPRKDNLKHTSNPVRELI